jgi:hypothetical protein
MRRAFFDPALDAFASSPRALRYSAGPDPALDRPGHVRAASSASFIGARLAIVQDDANFLALVDPGDPSSEVRAIPLAPGPGGQRLFDEGRGNKRHKLDLEASVVVPTPDGPLFLAFGSGSTERREQIVVGRALDGARPDVRMVAASQLYAALRANVAFAGSELNVEGVALVGARLRLFNRGNGASKGALSPVDATVDLELPSLLAHLLEGGPTPALLDVVPYDLGVIDGIRLGFTDAVSLGAPARGERVFYLAAAEASPDAYHDGPVTGVVLGVIGEDGVRCARIRTESGFFDRKAEGLALEADGRRGCVVIDRDAPLEPAELWQLTLSGPW